MHFHWVFYFKLVLRSEICNNYIHIYTLDSELRIWGSLSPNMPSEKSSLLIDLPRRGKTMPRFFPFFPSVHWVNIDWGLHQFFLKILLEGELEVTLIAIKHLLSWKTFPQFSVWNSVFGGTLTSFWVLISFSPITRVQWEVKRVREAAWGTQVAEVMVLFLWSHSRD